MAAASTPSRMPFQFTLLREGRQMFIGFARQRNNFNSRSSARGDRWGRWEADCCGRYFNSRSSARGDVNQAGVPYSADFNSRSSARGDGRRARGGRQRTDFNSRSSARGDGFALKSLTHTTYFNSRSSARGDTMGILGAMHGKFQFTLLREGRRHVSHPFLYISGISIHAPPRGATSRCAGNCKATYFNSRSSARGDNTSRSTRRKFFYFNSRSSARGDLPEALVMYRGIISIHAPPRGATPIPSHAREVLHFNSRSSARGDSLLQKPSPVIRISIHAPPRGATRERTKGVIQELFQFTLLREGRLPHGHVVPPGTQFQFTPLREGRRAQMDEHAGNQAISIHAPPRGATIKPSRTKRKPWKFQFTPLREGRRLAADMASFYNLISIHAPPRGATLTIDDISTASIFQFTPLREGRRGLSSPICQNCTPFQFTPLREGRRRWRRNEVSARRISIHAPPRGATVAALTEDGDELISIHAPPRGATFVGRQGFER